MDYSLCKPLQTFLKMYPTIHVPVILQLHNDLTSFESIKIHDPEYLKMCRIGNLRNMAKTFQIKYYAKLSKNELINEILQKQNSLSDTSSNSSGSDSELKTQPKKEEQEQNVQKKKKHLLYTNQKTQKHQKKKQQQKKKKKKNNRYKKI